MVVKKSEALVRKHVATGSVAAGALALGSFALGAFAVGALAIGTMAVRRLLVRKSHFDFMRIRELEVERLTVGELVVRSGPGAGMR